MTEPNEPGEDEAAAPTEGDVETPAEGVAATPAPRFREAKDEELDPQSFMVADERAALRAVLSGGSISNKRGDAAFLGGALRRIAKSVREVAEQYRRPGEVIDNILLRNVAWAKSIVFELEVSASERVDRTIDGQRRSPSIDGARALGDLLAAPTEQLLPQALRLGPKPTAEYKQFLRLLAGDDVTLEWQVPDAEQVAVVTSTEAYHDYAILSREGEVATQTIRVPGTLTMADSRRHKFELSLPPNAPSQPHVGRKQTIYGDYTEDLGAHLKAEGLWDASVMAVIEVSFDQPGTTPTPKDPRFMLISAEPLLDNSPELF